MTTLNRKWIKSNHLPYLISQRRLLPVPLLLRNIVEIERLLLRAAILVSNVLRGWAWGFRGREAKKKIILAFLPPTLEAPCEIARQLLYFSKRP